LHIDSVSKINQVPVLLDGWISASLITNKICDRMAVTIYGQDKNTKE